MNNATDVSTITAKADREFPIFKELESHLKESGKLKNVKIGWHCHLTAITAVAAKCLTASGADLYLSECTPATTEGSAVEQMRLDGATIHLGPDSPKRVLEHDPSIISDTGLVLTEAYLATSKRKSSSTYGASEITGSGISRLRNLKTIGLPVINLNDGVIKSKIENFHGVGDGLVEALALVSKRSFVKETATVVGYGQVGAGAAHYLRRTGVNVKIAETDPVRALLAHYDGYALGSLEDGLISGSLLVTATGKKFLISEELWQNARNDLTVVNLGHWQEEPNLAALEKVSKHQENLSKAISTYTLAKTGNKVHAYTGGAPANVALLTGSIEPTLLHLATEILTMDYLVEAGQNLAPGEQPLPYKLEKEVSRLALRALKR
ncbi:hypothetical protein GC174_07940 [bacterium]|nr:hypothetical protein [bacterium]